MTSVVRSAGGTKRPRTEGERQQQKLQQPLVVAECVAGWGILDCPDGPSREARLGWADDLPDRFEVLDKIGEGSFGTVWTARDRRCTEATAPLVALKRINPTCSPSRILNEYQQMRMLGGGHNVVEAQGVLRTSLGTFALIMPYFQHDDFKDYIKTLTLSGIAAYMRSLLTALAHVHAKRVIHRDIKPRNFMYKVASGKGLLIDFGLAEPARKWKDRVQALVEHRQKRQVRGTKREQQREAAALRAKTEAVKTKNQNSITAPGSGGAICAVSPPTAVREENSQKNTVGERGPRGVLSPPVVVASHEKRSQQYPADERGAASRSLDREERLRLLRKAQRAGTTGFRAPEVLWHSQDQDPAVDVWSAGVIFLCLLSRRYPLFPAADNDEMALVQVAALCGTDKLQRAARECGRCDIAEFPTVKQGSIRVLCAPLLGGEACDDVEARMRFEALSLVTAMLRVNPRERISAKDALAHAFVSGA